LILLYSKRVWTTVFSHDEVCFIINDVNFFDDTLTACFTFSSIAVDGFLTYMNGIKICCFFTKELEANGCIALFHVSICRAESCFSTLL